MFLFLKHSGKGSAWCLPSWSVKAEILLLYTPKFSRFGVTSEKVASQKELDVGLWAVGGEGLSLLTKTPDRDCVLGWVFDSILKAVAILGERAMPRAQTCPMGPQPLGEQAWQLTDTTIWLRRNCLIRRRMHSHSVGTKNLDQGRLPPPHVDMAWNVCAEKVRGGQADHLRGPRRLSGRAWGWTGIPQGQWPTTLFKAGVHTRGAVASSSRGRPICSLLLLTYPPLPTRIHTPPRACLLTSLASFSTFLPLPLSTPINIFLSPTSFQSHPLPSKVTVASLDKSGSC